VEFKPFMFVIEQSYGKIEIPVWAPPERALACARLALMVALRRVQEEADAGS
jgi:hypothetical protein